MPPSEVADDFKLRRRFTRYERPSHILVCALASVSSSQSRDLLVRSFVCSRGTGRRSSPIYERLAEIDTLAPDFAQDRRGNHPARLGTDEAKGVTWCSFYLKERYRVREKGSLGDIQERGQDVVICPKGNRIEGQSTPARERQKMRSRAERLTQLCVQEYSSSPPSALGSRNDGRPLPRPLCSWRTISAAGVLASSSVPLSLDPSPPSSDSEPTIPPPCS